MVKEPVMVIHFMTKSKSRDIYNYINSRDVAKHCREINKVWTPFEMAILIDRSHRPIAEKHAAWRKIIAEYPDMPMPVNDKGGSYESLHKKLAERIDYEEHLLTIFKKTEAGAVYRYNDWSGSYTDPDHVFDNFETALSDAVKYYGNRRDRVHVIRMTKSFINDDDSMTAFFNNDDNLDCVRIVGSRKQDELFPDITKNGCAFDAYVDIPMPFKRCDILTRNKGWDKEDDGIIFVLDSFDRDDPKWLEKHSSRRVRSVAEKARGFCVEESGHLYDYVSEYDHEQLEYYRGKTYIPQIGTIKFWLSNADNLSVVQSTAPVPRSKVALSITPNTRVSWL